MEANNKNLETLIKLRHLSEGLNSNWASLNSAKAKVNQLLDEANNIVKLFGSDIGKINFQEDANSINLLKDKIKSHLAYFKNMIESHSSTDSSAMFKEFQLSEYSGQTEPLNPGQTEPVIPGQSEPLIPVKLSHLRV